MTTTPEGGAGDEPDGAGVGRPSEAGSSRRRVLGVLLSAGAVVGLTGALLVAGTATGPTQGDEGAGASVSAAAALSPPSTIERLQADLKRLPANDRGWAQLGAAYVQQARRTADPGLYAQADGAFTTSLRLRPQGNDLALAGQASLAASRHEFARAVQLADQALGINPYSREALGIKVDGLTELGRYVDSRKVLQQLLDLHPGVDAFARASYAFELQGQLGPARDALQRALTVASAPPDQAFVHHYLGELAWNSGDLPGAAAAYERAVATDPSFVASLAGRAKVKAARGDVPGALADYRTAVAQQPQPATLLELGELLEATGDTTGADQQYAVLRATQQLYAAGGQVVDVELALFEADHGDPLRAVRLAEQAYAARPSSITVQDAYAWALHAAGRDRQALPLARDATRTGLPSAQLAYHVGVIEAAAGNAPAAQVSLTRALARNPGWSPLHAPRARALLDRLS